VAYGLSTSTHNNRRVLGHGGGAAGESTNWRSYRDIDWAGIILCNYDLDVQSIITRERRAVTGS
jgi:hypothetical protein